MHLNFNRISIEFLSIVFHRVKIRALVSVLVSGQYQDFLMVSELVKYVIQVPIPLFMHLR